MNHGSLFNGIGGFMMAAAFCGWNNIFHCEIDRWCNSVTKRNFPKSKQYGDIKKSDFSVHRGSIDVLSAGDPCQPHSVAGLGKGTSDDRYLWPEVVRAVRQIHPPWLVNENVTGTVTNGVLDIKIDDLESLGYTCQAYNIPAEAVGATHNRERIWLVAHNADFAADNRAAREIQGERQKEELRQWNEVQHFSKPVDLRSYDPHSNSERFQMLDHASLAAVLEKGLSGYFGFGYDPHGNIARNEIESAIIRMLNGLPDGMDYVDRYKRIQAIGNSIAPQIAYEIFSAIQQYEDHLNN